MGGNRVFEGIRGRVLVRDAAFDTHRPGLMCFKRSGPPVTSTEDAPASPAPAKGKGKGKGKAKSSARPASSKQDQPQAEGFGSLADKLRAAMKRPEEK